MCDAVVAVGEETASGAVLFAKNSDRAPGECQPFVQFGAASHPPGASVRCTHREIPQARETLAVMGHSPWWVWGFEHGVNERGVAIGNLTVFSNEPIEATPGLIGMDLVRLGLERGASARAALEVITGLLEAHGQGGAALAPGGSAYHNAFLIADGRGAWILETSNRHWAARPARLDRLTNHYGLGSDWQLASSDCERFAREEGFWREDTRLDVARAYRNPHIPAQLTSGRARRARELLLRDAGRHTSATLRALLCDHGADGAAAPAETSPEDEAHFTLCAHSPPVQETTASLVVALPRSPRPEAGPWPVFVSFATPCTGLFLPVYLDGVLPPALARGGEQPTARSAWWGLFALQSAARRNPARALAVIRSFWAELGERIERERAAVETAAQAEVRAGDTHAAAGRLSDFMERSTDALLGGAAALAERLAEKPAARVDRGV